MLHLCWYDHVTGIFCEVAEAGGKSAAAALFKQGPSILSPKED
jgi:hypothetical protein